MKSWNLHYSWFWVFGNINEILQFSIGLLFNAVGEWNKLDSLLAILMNFMFSYLALNHIQLYFAFHFHKYINQIQMGIHVHVVKTKDN